MALEERIRAVLADAPVTEKKMFGGLCFLHHGNMLCGVTNKGAFMVRVGKALEPEARELPGARDMDFTGKKMGGMLFVDDAAIADDEALAQWVGLCLRHAETLPPK
ncbi:MAG: TfoX/Sxy family protein [Myxococcales bacterium]|nr:TfoX/Sxy family protein [Myxococcales bacterium]